MPLIATKDQPDERRPKIDPVTGETRTKQPPWNPLQEEEMADLGRLALKHGHYPAFLKHWRDHRYSDPIDTIHLARELLTDLGIAVPPGTEE